MDKRLHKFISSTVSYHDFKEACAIASELNCGIEISRFGRLADIEDNFEKNKIQQKRNKYSIIPCCVSPI